MMRLRIGIVVVFVLLLGACAADQPSAGPEEPTTLAELDSNVRAAADALLQRESIPIVVIYFGYEDREEIVRYEWIDYRPGGDLLAVVKFLNQEGATGLARTGGEWRMAMELPGESTPWRLEPSLSGTPGVVRAIEQLEMMTTQQTPASPGSDPSLLHEATRQIASDGSELWTLIAPLEDGVTDTQQWIITPDGILQFYRLYLENAVMPDVGTIVVEYGVEDVEPEPVIIPDLGTKLRLNGLGIPDALRNLEE